jgi:N-acetylglucosaminyldiphosphoundecaprenol N-acetyl-beta-D-mannosaminyltransferase
MAPGPPGALGSSGRSVRVAGVDFDALSERQVVARIIGDSDDGRGGWVVTPNIDICRELRRDPALRALVSGASLVVADGMPLIWASRLRGDPLPERVAGASLIFTLSEAAAASGKSVYLLGGEPGVPARAAAVLGRRYPGLMVAGVHAPPFGFDRDPGEIEAIAARLARAKPDIVFVGLGFPKQERLIAAVAPGLPAAWFIGCGAAIPFAAGTLPRAPRWMHPLGLEWTYRLVSEPRRLGRRYLVNDVPFALRLLLTSALTLHKGHLARGGGPVLDGAVIGGPVLGGPVLGGPVLGGPVLGGPVLGGPVLGGPVSASSAGGRASSSGARPARGSGR